MLEMSQQEEIPSTDGIKLVKLKDALKVDLTISGFISPDNMGGSASRSNYVRESRPSNTESVRPRGQPEFDRPWRMMPWGNKYEIEKKLRSFNTSRLKVPYVRILLVGEVGVGKSSFINSVNNAFQGRITCEALVAKGCSKSFTKMYTTHYIEGEDGSPMPFVFNDIMGLESNEGDGAHTQDITTAVQGFLQEGYKFNPVSPASPNDPGYRSDPTLEEQTFCVVNIIGADSVSRMDYNVIDKMLYIREVATSLNLPQVIIMTKPDLACPLVNKDLRKIYTSKKIKEKMEECTNMLGIPMNHIFPVKNYHEEIDPDEDMDVLILKALDQIVNIAADAVKRRCAGASASASARYE